MGTSIGFTVHEKNLMDELKKKAEKLHKDVLAVSDLYDNVYYVIAVNLDRLRKAIDSLPNEVLEMIQGDADPELSSTNSLAVLGVVLGLGGKTFGALAGANRFMGGLQGLVRYWRSRPSDASTRESEHPLAEPTTLSKTPNFERLVNGLNGAQLVFGLAGLSAIIAIGVWTETKLERAIDEVHRKHEDVLAFQKSMEEVLSEIVTDAGLPTTAYKELKTEAEMWKNLSQRLESYESRMCYAIQGYLMLKSLDDVRKFVEEHTDAEDDPFPDKCFNLAKSLANEFRVQFDKGKTDKEIANFFATENQEKELRCVFNGFFIGSLRKLHQANM